MKHSINSNSVTCSVAGRLPTLPSRLTFRPVDYQQLPATVEVWGEDEFATIVAHQRIVWGHVVLLLTLKTAEERADLAAKVDSENWTVAELGNEIFANYGPRRPGSGRKPAIPRNVQQGLGRLLALATKSHNTLSAALFCKEFDLATELSFMPDTSVSPEIRQHVALALDAFKKLSEDLAEAAPRLEKLLPLLDHAIANKAIEQETFQGGKMIDLKVEADQTDRVYSAETDVLPSTRGRYLASMAEVRGWLDFVINSPWFCKRFPSIGKIVLLDGFGRQRAKCWYHDGASHIALPRAYRFRTWTCCTSWFMC